MSLMVAAVMSAQITPPPGLAVLGGLAGCWKVTGQVRGKDATSVARGEWHLGGRYFTLHLRAVTKQPYEAAITYGAGERPEAIGSVWMDTFGGLYEPSLGLGALGPHGFTQTYHFPDALYVNKFSRADAGWSWTIIEQPPQGAARLFADYHLEPSSCATLTFDF